MSERLCTKILSAVSSEYWNNFSLLNVSIVSKFRGCSEFILLQCFKLNPLWPKALSSPGTTFGCSLFFPNHRFSPSQVGPPQLPKAPLCWGWSRRGWGSGWILGTVGLSHNGAGSHPSAYKGCPNCPSRYGLIHRSPDPTFAQLPAHIEVWAGNWTWTPKVSLSAQGLGYRAGPAEVSGRGSAPRAPSRKHTYLTWS